MRGIALPLLLGALLACAGDPTRQADRAYTAGIAQVESLRVEVRSVRPASVWVWVNGHLPDPCTALESPHVQRTGSVFEIVSIGSRSGVSGRSEK